MDTELLADEKTAQHVEEDYGTVDTTTIQYLGLRMKQIPLKGHRVHKERNPHGQAEVLPYGIHRRK